MDILNHPFMLEDFLFALAILVIAKFARKKCAYGMGNILLAGQFMITTGFTVIVIWSGIYDGLYFNIFMMCVYFQYYHFIGNTGDRYLSEVSLWIGGYHFALVFGEVLGLGTVSNSVYGYTMIAFMTAQLVLAFRGMLYGLNERINHDRLWRDNNDNGHI